MSTATLLGVFLIPCLYVYVQFVLNLLGGDPRKKREAVEASTGEAPTPVAEEPVAQAVARVEEAPAGVVDHPAQPAGASATDPGNPETGSPDPGKAGQAPAADKPPEA
jgi:hypothetical protein